MNDLAISAKRQKVPGSGRRKGVPNRVTREIRELAQKYTNRAVKQVWKLAQDAKDEDVQLRAITLLLAYAHGKPTQRQELTGADGERLLTRIERVIVDDRVRDDGDQRDDTLRLVR